MPTEAKPLFHPDALRGGLSKFILSPGAVAARPKLEAWAKMLASGVADKKKETELLPGFISDVFEAALGYTRPPEDPYTLKREALIEVDGKFADAGLGAFGPKGDTFVAVLEGKGPRDPLDRTFAGRKRSAVEQAALYALQLRIDWYLVTNLRETRLYYKRQDTAHYERFETKTLVDVPEQYRRFVFLLGADRVVGPGGSNHLDAMLVESRKIGRELTVDYYTEYRDLRHKTFRALVEYNPGRDVRELLAATQKILDRVLFISFCEDRRLLPAESVRKAYEHEDEYNVRPVWENFKALFRWVDAGYPKRKISAYNGGLFASDTALDSLAVPDPVCEGFKKLADYEYGSDATGEGKLIDVEILGHIFEQSISDLEEMQRKLASDPNAVAAEPVGPTKRKREGAFYTPAFVTRYIVAETLGPVLRERFEAFRAKRQADVTGTAVRVLDNPRVFVRDKLNEPQALALVRFWRAWIGELEAVRVVDPSCGSGAFLIEAFDQLFAAYAEAEGFLTELGGPSLIDVSRSILTNNLFGMDLNGEAVEIARLSCWIKTAEEGKKLTALDGNIVEGNSVVAEPSPLAAWRTRFPDVFKAGGFDVVIGNPPYVRQEWISADKPFLKKHYRTFDGVADLYVYFYELGLSILKPGGRLGFISSNSFFRAGYAEGLRRYLISDCHLQQLINLGDTQIFEDAKDVYPAITIAEKNTAPSDAKVKSLGFRRNDELTQIESEVTTSAIEVPLSRLDPNGWQLDDPAVHHVRMKLGLSGIPLGTLLKGKIYSGLKTGLTEAFVISAEIKDRLLADGRSHEIIKPLVTGQDVRRWYVEDSGKWLILLPTGLTSSRCGSSDPAVARNWLKATYPAVESHLATFETAAAKRGDKGEFWWELRSCDYLGLFEAPKIVYPDIAKGSRFSLDTSKLFLNDTAFFLPTADLFLLGVLNSDTLWFALSGISVPFGERAGEFRYRLKIQYIEQLPIPKPTDAQRAEVETAVGRLIEIAGEQQAGRAAVLDWLRVEFGVAKVTQKLQAPAGLTADAFAAEVKKAGKKGLGVADVKRLKDEYAKSVVPLQTLATEAERLERRVSDIVNAAFGLTPDEVKLMWDTAPPRMPITRPA